tara:strand:- start:1558 stop:2379 length:822 start_codon:yes stop_codon:yes gene_type:complete
MKELFNLIKNKDDVYIEPVKYSGDKLSEKMKEIPQYLPKKNFSIYICGLPKSGKSTIIHSLLCGDGRKIRNQNKNKPKFYYKQFDKVFIFSPSIATQEKPFKLPPEQIYNDYHPEILEDIITELKEDDNKNCCFLFDDVIKSLNRNGGENSRILHKLLLNRRHILFNPNDTDAENIAGCSSIISSQRFNLLPAYIRQSGISHLILLKINSQKDLNGIWEEVANEMPFNKFKNICKFCWNEPHNFLYIILGESINKKYHKNFDLIDIDEDYLED